MKIKSNKALNGGLYFVKCLCGCKWFYRLGFGNCFNAKKLKQ